MNSLGRFAKFPDVGAEKYAMTRVVLGVAWLGMRLGAAGRGPAGQGAAGLGTWPGPARLGGAGHGMARFGKATWVRR